MAAVTQQTDLEMRQKGYFYFLDLTVLTTCIPFTCCIQNYHRNFRLSMFGDKRKERSCALTSAPSMENPFHH
jgi:hypothetical protein